MEILLFSLGTREIFGINVFKVREVAQTPAITKTPNMPEGVEGVLSMRGHIIPVLTLAKFIRADASDRRYQTMVVTEFNRGSYAFLVDSVDRIIQVDWEKIRSPERIMMSDGSAEQSGLITAVTEMDDGSLVSILDVEQILTRVTGESVIPDMPKASIAEHQYVFFCDDSVIARKEITMVLEKMSVKFQQANNGREAWERLNLLANRRFEEGEGLHDSLKVILVDAEMPEMDGYTLTRMIKADARFKDIPVIMHSSLSSSASRAMGASAGVNGYVAKFDPMVLAETLMPYLSR
ncbi:two-component system chemotaxis response regulator CheV [Paludibacterium purpuratum]|uniref:Two-component system chemotaxis response regulator CheV n=2 Tax=Paludibacterium purpuratum TaxID=1144873 RepID=A0A4R7B255_9NEIS|nr:chemotaxis protein [Paludibacterium purpuratum]TDR77812.1 two-component system chemotaxis response regulator CheV [Paludibacterium purpuratum]